MSTAAATSSSAGYSSERPTTMPITFGTASAERQVSKNASWSSRTSPPSRTVGSVVAAATASMSSTTGIFSHV